MATTTKQSLILATARNKQRVTLFLEPNLLIHARAQALVETRTLTALVERTLNEYLPKKTVIEKVEF